MKDDFLFECDKRGIVSSIKLFGKELLDTANPPPSEFLVNGSPLKLRSYPSDRFSNGKASDIRMKGESFVDHFAGWGLVLHRSMGLRENMEFPCFGIHYHIRREQAEQADLPCPGPGGPVIEAPLYVDSFTLPAWNWKFWGDDTRMIFPSSHSSGPSDEYGHVGYEHDTPEKCKNFMKNVWRRIYPGVMVIHGGVFYNAKTGHWLAMTCRRPHVGYILNIGDAGRGIAYNFTLHSQFDLGEALAMPEIKIYFGKTREEMWKFMADYMEFYLREPPEWVFKTLWSGGLAWNNKPTWSEQADHWERMIDEGKLTGISYSLVTNRPILSGTTPLGYEPDPNHGTIEEFRKMCRRISDKGVPMLIWLSHSGLMYRGGPDICDDWFITGIDGRRCAAWGTEDTPHLCHINPGHPGYIEYTKKWIRFYMEECGVKGFFVDCLGWAFPPDFTKRGFMRYPGDTNRMAIKFIEEIGSYIKELDPGAILFGEGTTFDAPVDLVSINHNPVRAIDGMGPRDYLLSLNRYSKKRIVLDQGPNFSAASGFTTALDIPGSGAKNKYMLELLRDKGGPRAFIPLPGDLAVMESEKLLVVPFLKEPSRNSEFKLPAPWDKTTELVEETDGSVLRRGKDGFFKDVPAGIYKMKRVIQ
ncbi:MAG TPA: hypothetical protein DET40_23270 [Lentisphaeria bacterium]|nr:MAG: hypothetical protein A2X45_24655 [Lentisphaerae bacterium GWF2_50_93]HCE46476.1 hypothetical protein [Lentisphaeria bacterium]